MKNISRRTFMFTSSGAAIGSFLAPGVVFAGEAGKTPPRESGLQTGRKIPLPYESIPGFLSKQQITPHYEAHYGGALRGFLAADEELQSGTPNGAAYGGLQRARSAKGNSVVLHENYFMAMARQVNAPTSIARKALEDRFGSVDRWAADFAASANAAAGWAILAMHPVNGKLYNVVSDTHDTGVLWMATPLIALDVYEHAYYVDYTSRKGDYIEKFMDHIDWRVVHDRFESVPR